MYYTQRVSRGEYAGGGALPGTGLWRGVAGGAETPGAAPLAEFDYGDVLLLAAERVSEWEWQVTSTNGPVKMLPFTSLGELPYTTYVNLG